MTSPSERLRNELADPAIYLEDPVDTERYSVDWIGKFRGTTPLVIRPRSTDEVSSVLQLCCRLSVPVVPQGGNTGMVGGSVPRAGEVVLSAERLNAIEGFDTNSATVTVQAGVVLADLQEYLCIRGYEMPVDLGARGSCQIGGMLATNAGGIKVIRYGHMREQLRGLEVVLADGTVLSNLNNLKKNNTGFDLKQLFVGSEGTLGVITRAVLQVQPVPKDFQTALLGIPGRNVLPRILEVVRKRFRDVSSLEFVDGETISFVQSADPDFRLPLDGRYASYVIIEEESESGVASRNAFVARLESLFEDELIADAVIASSEAQTKDIWRVREAPTETISRVGLTHKFDVTVPQVTIPTFLEEMEEVASSVGGVRAIQFGHLGDGNVHVNMAQLPGVSDADFHAKELPLATAVYDTVKGHNGSISAEHGIGIMKRDYLPLSRSPEEISLMRTLKAALDPGNILNPGVILDIQKT